jgi:hypothetical protein
LFFTILIIFINFISQVAVKGWMMENITIAVIDINNV